MEFPTLGEQCQKKDCSQIDFLPLQCKCRMVFCREHFNEHCLSGDCEVTPESRNINFENDDKIYKCSLKGCRKGNLHEMLCTKCSRHYCIDHRFHSSCPEIDDETMAARIEEFQAPRRQFMEANKLIQDKITENIRKALKSSAKVKTASKIHLMRIKQKALGPKSVPVSDRVYFAVKKPEDMQAKAVIIVIDLHEVKNIESIKSDPDLKGTVPLFVSKKWSLGRAIDSICDTCNIKNENNKTADTKIRIFRQSDGYCISPLKMNVEILDLMTREVLLEGDKLVMEYIDCNVINDLHEDVQIYLN